MALNRRLLLRSSRPLTSYMYSCTKYAIEDRFYRVLSRFIGEAPALHVLLLMLNIPRVFLRKGTRTAGSETHVEAGQDTRKRPSMPVLCYQQFHHISAPRPG